MSNEMVMSRMLSNVTIVVMVCVPTSAAVKTLKSNYKSSGCVPETVMKVTGVSARPSVESADISKVNWRSPQYSGDALLVPTESGIGPTLSCEVTSKSVE